MSIQTVEGFECGKWDGKPLEIEAIEENLTSDGGLLVFSQLDEKPGWTEQFSKMISDPRTDPHVTCHTRLRNRDGRFQHHVGSVPTSGRLTSASWSNDRMPNSTTAPIGTASRSLIPAMTPSIPGTAAAPIIAAPTWNPMA